MSEDVKINFYVPVELLTWFKSESARTGAPVAVLCRRAMLAFRYTTLGEETKPKPADVVERRQQSPVPVLIPLRG